MRDNLKECVKMDKLYVELLEVLRGYLDQNRMRPDEIDIRKWRESLHHFFEETIVLKARVLLRDREETFIWPQMGQEYDDTYMRTDYMCQALQIHRVKFASSPALMPSPPLTPAGNKRHAIMKAQVTLGP